MYWRKHLLQPRLIATKFYKPSSHFEDGFLPSRNFKGIPIHPRYCARWSHCSCQLIGRCNFESRGQNPQPQIVEQILDTLVILQLILSSPLSLPFLQISKQYTYYVGQVEILWHAATHFNPVAGNRPAAAVFAHNNLGRWALYKSIAVQFIVLYEAFCSDIAIAAFKVALASPNQIQFLQAVPSPNIGQPNGQPNLHAYLIAQNLKLLKILNLSSNSLSTFLGVCTSRQSW